MNKKKQKVNKVLEEQINLSFKPLSKLPNAEELKEQLVDSIKEQMDVSKEPPEILIGVGSGNDLDFSALEGLTVYDEIDAFLCEHKAYCEKCKNDEECQEYDDMCDTQENTWIIYTDGEVKENDDGTCEVVNDKLTIMFFVENNDYQVLKSPVIEKHGLCSLCFPNQADLNSEGTHKCYALPKEYLIGDTNE